MRFGPPRAGGVPGGGVPGADDDSSSVGTRFERTRGGLTVRSAAAATDAGRLRGGPASGGPLGGIPGCELGGGGAPVEGEAVCERGGGGGVAGPGAGRGALGLIHRFSSLSYTRLISSPSLALMGPPSELPQRRGSLNQPPPVFGDSVRGLARLTVDSIQRRTWRFVVCWRRRRFSLVCSFPVRFLVFALFCLARLLVSKAKIVLVVILVARLLP